MPDFLSHYHSELRLISFTTVLILMAVLEAQAPRRRENSDRSSRWPNNIGIVILDNLLVRVLLPVSTIAVALYAENTHTGLLHVYNPGYVLSIILSMLLLDVLIYAQHIVFHKLPWLWRFHRMHHSDTHMDVTTGIRFHPVEIILSILIKFAAILAFGIPAMAILLFEIVLNVTSMITHSNINIPSGLDRLIRFMFVTPDMHRIHHSVYREETDSNYGFNFSLWDRLFGTYVEQPRDTQEKMRIGLEQFRKPREKYLDKMLTQPFRNND